MGLVVLVETDQALLEKLNGIVCGKRGLTCATMPSLETARVALAEHEPHVLLIGPSVPPAEALAAGVALAADHPRVSIVLIAATVDADLLRAAMRSGFRDVLSASDGEVDVLRAVCEAHEASERGRRSSSPEEAGAGGGRVVTVFSTKGGVGKSVLATNLAVSLASVPGRRTVLVDLDLQFGDTGIMLKLEPTRTIHDAVQAFDRLDPEMLSSFLVPHSSGLMTLLAPVHPEQADAITVNRVSRILSMVREVADYVVVDTPAAYDDIVLAALDKSDEIYAVATMDVASIKNTRISLQKLSQIGYDMSRIGLVMNRADSKVWLDPSEVEKACLGNAVAKIPSDRLVPRSVNKGVPIVLDAPKSGVARAINDLASHVVAAAETAEVA